VQQALQSRRRPPALLYFDPGAERALHEVLQAARKREVPTFARGRAELDRLAGEVRHQGVVALSGDYPYVDLQDILEAASSPTLLVALDEITDPHNLGAIVRSAVAFGAGGLVIPKNRSASVTPAVVRVSTGATEDARIAQVTNLARSLRTLREQGLEVVGLAGDVREEEDPRLHVRLGELGAHPEGRVLVIGSEGRGMRRMVRQSCDRLARIELPGPVQSLNASVAAGIALHVLRA
jgi:23S rRNA (guanosine2251-2'-O)-methyltransferase